MIKGKSSGLLVVVSGPSGVGKDTVCRKIISEMDDVKMSVSMTSRNPRINETEGIDYYFVTEEEFKARIENDDFLEYAIVHSGHYYGTPKSKIDEYLNNGISVILNIDIQGALQVKELVDDALFIFIMPPNMETLIERLKNRKTESIEQIIERFKTAYKEINEFKKYNYVVVNDEVEFAANKIKAIMLAEKCRVDRIEEIYLNTPEEFIHEELMEQEFDNSPSKILQLKRH